MLLYAMIFFFVNARMSELVYIIRYASHAPRATFRHIIIVVPGERIPALRGPSSTPDLETHDLHQVVIQHLEIVVEVIWDFLRGLFFWLQSTLKQLKLGYRMIQRVQEVLPCCLLFSSHESKVMINQCIFSQSQTSIRDGNKPFEQPGLGIGDLLLEVVRAVRRSIGQGAPIQAPVGLPIVMVSRDHEHLTVLPLQRSQPVVEISHFSVTPHSAHISWVDENVGWREIAHRAMQTVGVTHVKDGHRVPVPTDFQTSGLVFRRLHRGDQSDQQKSQHGHRHNRNQRPTWCPVPKWLCIRGQCKKDCWSTELGTDGSLISILEVFNYHVSSCTPHLNLQYASIRCSTFTHQFHK